MNKGFDIIVLDESYNIISLLNYTLLQWTRKYYESGYFSIQIPIELYSKDFKYIYTEDRPEFGLIEQVNYYIKDNYKSITISGHFLENELNRRIVYRKANNSNIVPNVSWTVKSGNAESVAYDFFNTFKDVGYKERGQYGELTKFVLLGVNAGTNLNRGKYSEHTRGNERLGDKVYRILRYSKLSYRVSFDFENNRKIFNVWSGVDRTQGNSGGNNSVIFSTQYGNITNADLLLSSTDYKNAYIVGRIEDYEGNSFSIAGFDRLENTMSFIYRESAEIERDYSSRDDFINALKADGHERLLEYPKKISLDFDVIQSSYIYREDFDLGDICSIELPELGISTDAVLSEIYEVVRDGVWTMTLGFALNDDEEQQEE